MIVTSEYIYFNPSIDSINDIIQTASKEHSEKYGHDDFCKITMKSIMELIDLINNKTKNISFAGRDLMYKAH